MGDRCCQCFNGQSVDPDRFTDTLRALHGELVLEMREAFKEFGVFNTAFFDSLDVIHNVCEVGVVFFVPLTGNSATSRASYPS